MRMRGIEILQREPERLVRAALIGTRCFPLRSRNDRLVAVSRSERSAERGEEGKWLANCE
jgi:hypothetical protein